MYKAFLIIDMQKGSFTKETPRYNSDLVVDNINALSEKLRSIDQCVIFIQHDGSQFGEFSPPGEQWELLDELKVEPEDKIIAKTANDAFYHSDLHQLLQDKGITELYISGCASDFCVEATVQSGLTKGYKITVVRDAHTTADRPFVAAKQLIDHYNDTWKNMIPVPNKIDVLTTHEIINEL